MKEPNSLEDFNRLSSRQKTKWINSASGNDELRAGFIVEPGIDLMLYFERGANGCITKIKAEKITDVKKRHAQGILADRALAGSMN